MIEGCCEFIMQANDTGWELRTLDVVWATICYDWVKETFPELPIVDGARYTLTVTAAPGGRFLLSGHRCIDLDSDKISGTYILYEARRRLAEWWPKLRCEGYEARLKPFRCNILIERIDDE